MKKLSAVGAALIMLSLLLASCKLPAPANAEPTQVDAQAVFTAAAQTAEAMRLARAASATIPPPETLIATIAVSTPTRGAATPVGMTSAASPPAIIPTTAAPAASDDKAEFVGDVTVPDGTIFEPGEPFTKTWRLKNTGATTWSTEYLLLFIDGALMDAPASVPVPKTVAPNESVDISVGMVAPAEPGSYRGFWKLKSAGGQIFGLGAAGNEAIWVDIVVQGAQAAGGTTPTAAGSGVLSKVSLSVDNAAASEPCPYTFRFTAQFTLSKAATVTYSLEVGDNNGTPVKTPPPATQNLQPGAHSVVYELSFPQNLNGWARLHIVAPDDMRSNQINFTLACV